MTQRPACLQINYMTWYVVNSEDGFITKSNKACIFKIISRFLYEGNNDTGAT
jgi:hypothetical protein